MENKQAHRVSRTTQGRGPETSRDVGRIDVVCGPEVTPTVVRLVDRWAQDRGLTDGSCERITALVRASMAHGLRFDPRGVTLLLGLLDRAHVRLDVRWHGSASTARAPVAQEDVAATISTLDAVADQWGFGIKGGDPVHWMILDARSSPERGAGH